MLLKPNMVVAGKTCKRQPVVEEVAAASSCSRRTAETHAWRLRI